MVAAFFIAYFTEDDWLSWHVVAGYTVLGLVLFRLLWGLIGTHYARFSSFVYSPGDTLAYIKAVFTGKAARYLGHNPAGGAMIIVLLLGLLATTVSGLMLYGADAWQGPLAEWMKETSDEGIDITQRSSRILRQLHAVSGGCACLRRALGKRAAPGKSGAVHVHRSQASLKRPSRPGWRTANAGRCAVPVRGVL